MADVGTGGSVTFATSSFTGSIMSIEWDEVTREAIETTHLGTTGARTYIVGDLHEPGGVTLEIQFDPDAPPPYSGAAETVTIRYPVPAGSSTGASLAATGFIDSWTPGSMTVDELMMQSIHVKLTGAITQADAS